MRTLHLAAYLALIALAACAPAGPARSPGAPTASVAIGETARLEGVAVTPLAVLEDSRCARDATCIWAGRVRITARIEAAAGADRLVEMESGQPVAVSAGTAIVLSAVHPERVSGAAIPAGAYRFTFTEAS